ncbi:UBC-like protein [Agrocybe pediades]|nr:UBC-like protein [Agrocybe pediades]
MATAKLNKNNSAVKRIMQEARELANDPCTDYSAAPLEDDIFEWHCTLRGPAGTEFEGGLYHFRILLPAEYPFRPPSIMILTPNGRFELNTKICISFTSYHEELWQPAWGVRTAIIGLQGFFPLKGQAAIGVGSIEYPAAERKRLAALSREWKCPHCQLTNLELLPDPPSKSSDAESDQTDRTADVQAKQSEMSQEKEEGNSNEPTPAPLTPAQEEAMRTMAKALHDRLDSIRDQEGNIVEASETWSSSVPEQSRNVTSVHRNPSAAPGEVVAQAAERSSTASASSQGASVTPPSRSTQKPPLLLDSAICVLLVLLFAIICRRMV